MKDSGDKIIKQQVDNLQVSFDKEAAWMKLQDRLESKDEQRGYLRVAWVAAAVLLLASVVWYSLQGDAEKPVVKDAVQETTLPAVKEPMHVQEDIGAIPKEPRNITIVTKKHKTIKVATEKIELPLLKEIPTEPIVMQQETRQAEEVPKVVSAPKPKMKVVHINEVIEQERTERKMQNTKYANNKKYFFIKPAVEREDTQEPFYGLFGTKKEIAN